jgi:hypothetical protein
VEQVARDLVGLHGTTASTVYLSAWARVPGFTVADMDRALYDERTLVKQMAMRRTLFVVPVGSLDVVCAAVGARVAEAEARRLVRDVERAGLHPDGAAWLRAACSAVLAALDDGRELTAAQLRAEVPLLEGTLSYGAGRSWGGAVPIGPRVLTVLSAEGRVVRAANQGAWTASRPRWAAMRHWTGRPVRPMDPGEALARLVRAWLLAFGPGTEQDLKWWLGGTIGATRRALARLEAVEVALEGGGSGYLLPEDLAPAPAVAPWAALLPELDPTTMGWYGRDWYLGAHRPAIFDSAGNAGNTAWWQGRIVGGWAGAPDGEVVLHLLEDVGAEGRRALAAEAERLTGWLGGTSVRGGYPSPLVRRLGGAGPGRGRP